MSLLFVFLFPTETTNIIPQFSPNSKQDLWNFDNSLKSLAEASDGCRVPSPAGVARLKSLKEVGQGFTPGLSRRAVEAHPLYLTCLVTAAPRGGTTYVVLGHLATCGGARNSTLLRRCCIQRAISTR